jgi:hypothetical protein
MTTTDASAWEHLQFAFSPEGEALVAEVAEEGHPFLSVRCVGSRYPQVSRMVSKSTVTTPFALSAKCCSS